MGLPLLCLMAVCNPPPAPSPHSLTSATTPTLSLCAGPWLTPRIQGSGSGQQTPSQLGGCPEELMQLWAAGEETQETRGTRKGGARPWCVYKILNLGRHTGLQRARGKSSTVYKYMSHKKKYGVQQLGEVGGMRCSLNGSSHVCGGLQFHF